MRLTRKALDLGRSSKGGWSDSQWRALGVTSKRGGWMKRLVGSCVTDDKYQKFLDLKDEHLKNKGNFTSFRDVKKENKIKVSKPPKSEYLDERWLNIRKRVLKRDNFTCLICKEDGKKLHVHHWRYQGKHVWDTNMMFLASLCEDCHKKAHAEISRDEF